MTIEQAPRQRPVIPNVVGMYLRNSPHGAMNAGKSVLDMQARDGSSLLAFGVRGYGLLCGITSDRSVTEQSLLERLPPVMRNRRIMIARNYMQLSMRNRRNTYNVVALNYGLDNKNAEERRQLVVSAQTHTEPGGVNLVSGIIENVRSLNAGLPRSRSLYSDELKNMYFKQGWTILGVGKSDVATSLHGEEPWLATVDSVIAQKPVD